MPRVSSLIDAYIDANIILLIAFLVWCLARTVLARTPLKHEFCLQLRLSEGFLLAVLVSPILAFGITEVFAALMPGRSINAADIAISQFLNGRVSMDAVQFETLLGTRQDFVVSLAYLEGNPPRAIAAVFFAGIAFHVGRAAIGAWSLHNVIAKSYVWRQFGRLDLRLSDEIRVPFSTRGLWRRHIVIPSGLLAEPTALRIALTHELQHMRRNDTEWELALVIFYPFFFWNPAFCLWKRNIALLRELSCDQVVINKRQISPRAYADCLLSMCRRGISGRGAENITVPVVPFLHMGNGATGRRNFQALRQRVLAISGPAPRLRRPGAFLWAPLVVACLLIGIGASAIQRPGDWSQDRLMLSTVVNLERLETLNTSLIRSW